MKPLPTYIENIKISELEEGFDANKYPLPDLMNRYCGKQVAMILRLAQKWKLYTDRIQAEINVQKRLQSHSFPCGYRLRIPLSNARNFVDKDI
ncbi:hypothetical protein P7H17_25200 [Paenibacillus larvae]|nr:hypothetical protein [Paenibacillus larvae]MDT2288683.1 hypothetical protein [Paenibacillus larvae]